MEHDLDARRLVRSDGHDPAAPQSESRPTGAGGMLGGASSALGSAVLQRKLLNRRAQKKGETAHAAKSDAHEHEHEHDKEAEDGEETSSASVPLKQGKPPGNVQRKAHASPQVATPRKAHRAPAVTIAQATSRYAPLVFLAPGEKHGPADAGAYIGNSSLRWSHDSGRGDHEIAAKGHVDAERLGGGGYEHQVEGAVGGHHGDKIQSNDDCRPKDGKGDGGNEGFFLDLDNSKRSMSSGTEAPVYFEAVDQHYITYWFFYAYNDGPLPKGTDAHEGDWERIVVKLDRSNRATDVAYYQHNGHEVKRWKDVPKQGTHPLVFSGKGSHASYASAGEHNLPGPWNDKTGRGKQWKTWSHLQNARQQSWYGYGGAWGEVGTNKHTTGPQGPSKWKGAAPKGW